jgi:hypothetical protein
MNSKPRETLSYKRDETGHLLCEKCGFKPKSTVRHPQGNVSTMHYHMKKHINDFPYECSVCKTGFPQKQNLLNHMKARHPDRLKQRENMHKCPIEGCHFESITKGNCLIHCARLHYSEAVEPHLQHIVVDDKKYSHCTCCDKQFKSPTAYYYHILKCLHSFDFIDVEPLQTIL